jgi:recombination protein RecA
MARKSKRDIEQMRKATNKKAGRNVAFSLMEENPNIIEDWISTGSTVLDSIVATGIGEGGLPVGKIVELAGLSSTGKSYLAAIMMADAQRKGMVAVLYDSESAVDPKFLLRAGVDLENLIYIQAESMEFVMQDMEDKMSQFGEGFFFCWDSVANTKVKAEEEIGYNPNKLVGVAARVLSLGMRKLTIPLGVNKCVL